MKKMMMMIEKDIWMKIEIAMFMVGVVGRTCESQSLLNDIILTSKHQQIGSSGIYMNIPGTGNASTSLLSSN